MNLTHLHLILNHVPVIGFPIATAFLFYFVLTRNLAAQKFSLVMLIVIAAFAIPVFLSGEPAEEMVEHIAGVSETFLEAHEDAGKIAFTSTLLTGFTALLCLWLNRRERQNRASIVATLIVSLFTTAVLARTAYLGGQIRHSEIRENETLKQIRIENHAPVKEAQDFKCCA